MIFILAACVQPVPPTPTPGPTNTAAPAPTPTSPAVAPPVVEFPPERISAWLIGYGVTAANIDPFIETIVGGDRLVGFTFSDANNQVCGGIIQTSGETIWTGDFRCGAPSSSVITFPLLFTLTSGDMSPWVATFIYVNPNVVTGAYSFAIEYADGVPNSGSNLLTNNGYIAARAGVNFPTLVTILDQNGNAVLNELGNFLQVVPQ